MTKGTVQETVQTPVVIVNTQPPQENGMLEDIIIGSCVALIVAFVSWRFRRFMKKDKK